MMESKCDEEIQGIKDVTQELMKSIKFLSSDAWSKIREHHPYLWVDLIENISTTIRNEANGLDYKLDSKLNFMDEE